MGQSKPVTVSVRDGHVLVRDMRGSEMLLSVSEALSVSQDLVDAACVANGNALIGEVRPSGGDWRCRRADT